MAKNWWFKFDWDDWLGDEDLSACSLETQGFWLRCICIMYRSDTFELTGTVEQLRRKLGILPEELERCVYDLKNNNAGDVRFCNNNVSILSRRRQREVKAKENNRLAVAKHRGKAERNTDVRVQSKSKSKSKEKEEEKREEAAVAAPAPEVIFEPDRFNHPAVVEFESVFGFKAGSGFATSVARKVSNLGIWTTLLQNKRAYADKPIAERRKVCNWILDEYDKRVKDAPKIQRLPTVEERQREEEANLQVALRPPPKPTTAGAAL